MQVTVENLATATTYCEIQGLSAEIEDKVAKRSRVLVRRRH